MLSRCSKRAFQHVRYDFHVAVRVRRKAVAAGDAVVVHDAQRAKLHVLGIEIIGERKREVGVQPAVVGVPAFVALANGNHQATSQVDEIERDDNTRYNDYCQEVY